MRERVSVIHGKQPVLLVAPHGADDTRTALIAEKAAVQVDCCAVINRGFERHDVVDVDRDQADCNRIDHCKEEVVYDEFLQPIVRIKDKFLRKWFNNNPWSGAGGVDPCACMIFHIHGCGDIVHKEANEAVGVIVGYGLGVKKDSLTCEVWRKNLFIDLFRNTKLPSGTNPGDAFEGKAGGRYAGRDTNNLNQYFRKHAAEALVDSMQLEFPYSARKDDAEALVTAEHLANIITNMMYYSSYALNPQPKFI